MAPNNTRQYVIGSLVGLGLLGASGFGLYSCGSRAEEVVGIANSGSYIIPIENTQSVVKTKVVQFRNGEYGTFVCEYPDSDCIPNAQFSTQLDKRAQLGGLRTEHKALEKRLAIEAGIRQ